MPAVPVRDLGAALRFYCDGLGFVVRHRFDNDGGAILVRNGVELHLTRLNDESWKTRADFATRPVKSGAESFLPGTASLRVEVNNVHALHDEFASRRIMPNANAPLREQSWGDTDFAVSDPDRNLVFFFQRGPAAREA
jgi:catechol 2,3-dioxygenase-like lactoylglutathione lyase family enzyme